MSNETVVKGDRLPAWNPLHVKPVRKVQLQWDWLTKKFLLAWSAPFPSKTW
jgi:hypothetical protein